MKQALDGWLYIITAQIKSAKLSRFYDDVRSYSEQHFDVSPSSVDVYAIALYNAVYLFAHAATRVLREGGDVKNGLAMVEAMRGVSFKGVLERSVELDENGFVFESYSIMNYLQWPDGTMQSVEVGLYDSGKLDFKIDEVRWPGNASGVPVDNPGSCLHASAHPRIHASTRIHASMHPCIHASPHPFTLRLSPYSLLVPHTFCVSLLH